MKEEKRRRRERRNRESVKEEKEMVREVQKTNKKREILLYFDYSIEFTGSRGGRGSL